MAKYATNKDRFEAWAAAVKQTFDVRDACRAAHPEDPIAVMLCYWETRQVAIDVLKDIAEGRMPSMPAYKPIEELKGKSKASL